MTFILSFIPTTTNTGHGEKTD